MEEDTKNQFEFDETLFVDGEDGIEETKCMYERDLAQGIDNHPPIEMNATKDAFV